MTLPTWAPKSGETVLLDGVPTVLPEHTGGGGRGACVSCYGPGPGVIFLGSDGNYASVDGREGKWTRPAAQDLPERCPRVGDHINTGDASGTIVTMRISNHSPEKPEPQRGDVLRRAGMLALLTGERYQFVACEYWTILREDGTRDGIPVKNIGTWERLATGMPVPGDWVETDFNAPMKVKRLRALTAEFAGFETDCGCSLQLRFDGQDWRIVDPPKPAPFPSITRADEVKGKPDKMPNLARAMMFGTGLGSSPLLEGLAREARDLDVLTARGNQLGVLRMKNESPEDFRARIEQKMAGHDMRFPLSALGPINVTLPSLPPIRHDLSVPSVRTQNRALIQSLVDHPPRWALDGRGCKRGPQWERYQIELARILESVTAVAEPFDLYDKRVDIINALKDIVAPGDRREELREDGHFFVYPDFPERRGL